MPHTGVHPYTNRLCGLKRNQSSDPKDWVGTMKVNKYVYNQGSDLWIRCQVMKRGIKHKLKRSGKGWGCGA